MRKVKILVVEDEIIIADDIADTLEDLGYEVLGPVISYSAAIPLIEEEMPDLALLDLQLSGRKSGIDLGLKINETYQFPFIFLTSNSDKATLEEAKKVEPSAYLLKPYSKEEL
ncbi:MAG: response regulator, partial [Bacteroidota bacterium]